MQRYELFLNWQIFLQEIFNKKQKIYQRLIFVKGKTGVHLIILYSMPGLPDLNYIENLGGGLNLARVKSTSNSSQITI
jgi:hypothetical protein